MNKHDIRNADKAKLAAMLDFALEDDERPGKDPQQGGSLEDESFPEPADDEDHKRDPNTSED